MTRRAGAGAAGATSAGAKGPAEPSGAGGGPTPGETSGAGGGTAPAYYAKGHGVWRDVKAVLHPPYTAWHLSSVVLGALCGRYVSWSVLVATLLAFFLAVGVSAHALDELRGRPLATTIPAAWLVAAAAVGLAGAVALGALGVARIGPALLAFIAVGTVLVVGYSLELFGGRIHTDLGFALAWGAFPVLTAAYAENKGIPPAAIVMALAAALLSAAQRSLSTPARNLRRRARSVEGNVLQLDGTSVRLDRPTLLAPLEASLRYLSFTSVALAVSLVLLRLQIG